MHRTGKLEKQVRGRALHIFSLNGNPIVVINPISGADFVINDDTKKLLSECNAGIKMAVSSIDEIMPKVKSEQFEQLLLDCKHEHEALGNETHRLLNEAEEGGEEPNPIAKGMSWIKTNTKLTMKPTDHTAADLITEGCNMGVKSLNRYLNQYQAADQQAKSITEQLIHSEEQLSVSIRPFL